MLIRNLTTGAQMEFGGSYVLNLEDLGVINDTHYTFKSIWQDGQTVTKSTLESREIQLVGYIMAENEEQMRAKKRRLTRLINPLNALEIVKDGYRIECLATTTVRYATEYQENNANVAKFTFSAFCPDPFFTPITEQKADIAMWRGAFRFPLVIESGGIIMGLREPSLIANVMNKGDMPCGMRIEFVARSTVVNPSLFNVNTREFIKINKTMLPGEAIVITTHLGKKKVTGRLNGIASNLLHCLDLASHFMQLEVGDNLFRYDADEHLGNLEVNIYHSPRYLGV